LMLIRDKYLQSSEYTSGKLGKTKYRGIEKGGEFGKS
jgi:hypothetical protein